MSKRTTRVENAAARAARAAARAEALAAEARSEDQQEKIFDAETQPQADVRELLQGLPQDAEIKLYRMIPGSAKSEFCEAFTEPGEFNENAIRAKWGGGTFRLLVRVPDKQGRMVFPSTGAGKVFRLAMPPAHLTPSAPAPEKTSAKWEDTMAMQLFQALMAQQQQQAQSMRESQESHRAMIAMMLRDSSKPDASIEMMKTFLPLMMPARADPMELALKVAAMLKPAGPTAGIVEQMTMLEKFLAIIKRGEGGSGPERPVWFEALKEVAPLIQQAFTTPKPEAAVRPPPPVSAIPPVQQIPEHPELATRLEAAREHARANPPAPPEAPVIQLHPMIAQLDRMMPVLIESAALDLNLDLQADWALERIPESHFEEFVEWIERPEAVDMLMLRYPAAAVYRNWFTGLVRAMLAAIVSEEEDAEAASDDVPMAAPAPEPAKPAKPSRPKLVKEEPNL